MVGDKGLISVIVPVYKVEKYLHRCVDSILNQTYKNLEVILIDDGSPDNCSAICDEYAAKDSRVRVFHQKNAGVSAARNAGLDAATGDYIAFVDSDDWLEPDMYQTLHDVLQKSQADIACCECYLEEGSAAKVLTVGEKGCSSIEEFLQGAVIGQNHALIALWTKLYRRHIFDSVRFVEGIVSEDCVIAIDICVKQPKFVVVRKAYYHYNKENNVSLTRMKISPQEGYGKFLWLTKWLNLPADFHTDTVVNVAKKNRLKFALRAYEMNYVKPILSEERANEIVEFLNDVDNYNDVSSHRFLCWCFRNCRWVVNMLAKIRYGGK